MILLKLNLHIRNCFNSEYSLFYSFCYSIRYSKVERVNQCSDSDYTIYKLYFENYTFIGEKLYF